MTTLRAPRWALSFADLCLLLLGFFVILHARRDDDAMPRAMREAFGGEASAPTVEERPAAALFQPGEAVLMPSAARWLAGLGAATRRSGGRILIVSRGADGGNARLDGWELAAARTAAAARAIRAGGLADDRVILSIPGGGDDEPAGQVLRIDRISAAR